MKQVVQSFRTGELAVRDVPTPVAGRHGVLIRTAASLVSAGTERMIVDFASKNLVEKAKARPDLVRQVLDKAQREGVLNTLDAVRNRLDKPLPLGYSSAGVVTAVGAEVAEFQVGDRVACAGGGFASHSEAAYVPRNLAVKLPAGVPFEDGAFGTLGAIALQGIRQAGVELGHMVAVIGLGLLGQLTIQMLKAAGCRVFGVDINPDRLELARRHGIDAASATGTALAEGMSFSGGRGFDAVLLTADTKSNDPVTLAGELARDKAVVVAVGAVGLEIPRKIYYEKELDLRLSRSYGPGRYDPAYEEKGQDYPYGYVRWTEQRNIEAFVQLLASGSVKVGGLISHRFAIDEAERAYRVITGEAKEPFLGVVLTYDLERELPVRIALERPAAGPPRAADASPLRFGVLGAGNFVNATLLPAMKKVAGLEPIGVVSASGLTARSTGDRFGFAYCTSKESELLEDARINWLVVATRHHLHARQAIAGMEAGKDVFVEKPLALDRDELVEVVRVVRQTGRRLMVGFNRRFAPMVRRMRQFLEARTRPLSVVCRVNAGAIPAGHWTHDPGEGGGRIVGEACHFVDLVQFLVGAPPVEVFARAVQADRRPVDDEVSILLTFADGSTGLVVYTAGGDKSFGKERVEALGSGRVATLDDYHTLDLVHQGRRTRHRERLRPDKGHRGEWEALVAAVRSGAADPVDVREIVATHLATFAVLESLKSRLPVPVAAEEFWSAVEGPARQDRENP